MNTKTLMFQSKFSFYNIKFELHVKQHTRIQNVSITGNNKSNHKALYSQTKPCTVKLDHTEFMKKTRKGVKKLWKALKYLQDRI